MLEEEYCFINQSSKFKELKKINSQMSCFSLVKNLAYLYIFYYLHILTLNFKSSLCASWLACVKIIWWPWESAVSRSHICCVFNTSEAIVYPGKVYFLCCYVIKILKTNLFWLANKSVAIIQDLFCTYLIYALFHGCLETTKICIIKCYFN